MGIRMKSPASKDEVENPQSSYFDGGLLPIINTDGGKKRRKTRKNKRKSKRRHSRRK